MSCAADGAVLGEASASATTGSTEENGEDIMITKRPAPVASDEDGSNTCDIDVSSRPSKVFKKDSTPNYGSKEYWEARYKSHASAEADVSTRTGDDAISKELTETSKTIYEETTPGHEWYFSYDELQPLIMPLILGESDDVVVDSDCDDEAESWVEEEDDEEDFDHNEEVEEEYDEDEHIVESDNEDNLATSESGNEKKVNAPSEGKQSNENVTERDNAIVDTNETNSNDQADILHSTMRRPKRVLEVGCGDMPLGTALVLDLLSMQANSQVDANSIVEEVTCIDYSDTVVQSLIEKVEHEYKTSPADGVQQQSAKSRSLQPTFRALDARSLPFQSNTYDLILEKGTLDAMLSDKVEGLTNCIEIVKEMARVACDGGAILIVSHLNANEPKGMVWLEDVVFNGLKAEFLERSRSKGIEIASTTNSLEKRDTSDVQFHGGNCKKEFVWSVEVHGGHGTPRDTNGSKKMVAADNHVNDNHVDDEDHDMVYGPAVYILRKKSIPAMVARELFGKKRAETANNVISNDSDGDDDTELVEMPPVKLSFLSYDGE
jgi:SAM-dependent methyltransferase